jgi:hypothetical protein
VIGDSICDSGPLHEGAIGRKVCHACSPSARGTRHGLSAQRPQTRRIALTDRAGARNIRPDNLIGVR